MRREPFLAKSLLDHRLNRVLGLALGVKLLLQLLLSNVNFTQFHGSISSTDSIVSIRLLVLSANGIAGNASVP